MFSIEETGNILYSAGASEVCLPWLAYCIYISAIHFFFYSKLSGCDAINKNSSRVSEKLIRKINQHSNIFFLIFSLQGGRRFEPLVVPEGSVPSAMELIKLLPENAIHCTWGIEQFERPRTFKKA